MNVGTALNKKYIPYTTTMLVSLCSNNKKHVNAYLFNSELDEADIEDMYKSLSGHDITLIDVKVDKSAFSDRFPRSEQWSLEAYYRLFMFELLPDSVDRLIYLDGDIIVNQDISDFYSSEYNGAEMFVCDDKGGLNTPDKYGEKHREMFKEAYSHGFRYFNSGMLLINVKQMRHTYSFDTYFEAIKRWNYEMEAPDQDILNDLHWKNVKYVNHEKFDLFARLAHNQGKTYEDVKKNVAIIHYTGYKPWESGNFHFDIEKIWWEYARKTLYYNDLLESFVNDVLNDCSVAESIRQLERDCISRKKLLKKTMGVIEKMLGGCTSESEGGVDDSGNTLSRLDQPEWEYGYVYSEDEKRKWTAPDNREEFLDNILFDTRAENYAMRLYEEIKQMNEALDKANMILGAANS